MPRILVVDDDETVRKVIRCMLEPTGMEIVESSDGRDAVRTFRASPVDLVLCDLFMPDKDGLEVLRELTTVTAGIKVVVMSGGGYHGKVDMLSAARHFGAAAVLRKPFDQPALLQAIRQALRQ